MTDSTKKPKRAPKKWAHTDPGIAKMRPPKTGRIEQADTTPGLYLRVTCAGVRSWRYGYRLRGQGKASETTGKRLASPQKWITLGTFPELSVKDARIMAEQLREQVTSGKDPSKPTAPAHMATTVSAIAAKFLKYKRRSTRERTVIIAELILRKHILPVWGEKQIGEIRKKDLRDLLTKHVDAKAIGTAREIKKTAVMLFRWAVSEEDLAATPFVGLVIDDLSYPLDSGRALNDSELRAFWCATGSMGKIGSLLRLIALTACRRSEWGSAVRSEINTTKRALVIPMSRYKTGRKIKRDHTAPMSDLAWQIYSELPVTESPYLFSDGPVEGWTHHVTNLRTRMRAELGLPAEDKAWKFTLKDLRITCRTRLTELGVDATVSEAVLGHVPPPIVRIYDKSDPLEAMRAALQLYSDHLIGIVNQ